MTVPSKIPCLIEEDSFYVWNVILIKIKNPADFSVYFRWKPRERTMVDSLSAPAAREERIYNTTTVKDKFL